MSNFATPRAPENTALVAMWTSLGFGIVLAAIGGGFAAAIQSSANPNGFLVAGCYVLAGIGGMLTWVALVAFGVRWGLQTVAHEKKHPRG